MQKISVMVYDQHILPFGMKKMEVEIEEGDRKIKTTVMVDNDDILNLLKVIRLAESVEIVQPYIKNGLDQVDISSAMLRIMSQPPHNIIFCPSKDQADCAITLIGPKNTLKNLAGNYSAHAQFYFYGRGKSSGFFDPKEMEKIAEQAIESLKSLQNFMPAKG